MSKEGDISSSSVPKKTGRGLVLNSQSRLLAFRLYNYFVLERDNRAPLLPLAKVVQRAADALQISRTTVSAIINQFRRVGNVGTPGKKRYRPPVVTNLDSFDQERIKDHIYSYYERKEWPNRRKLLISLKQADLFQGEKTALSHILQKLNFKWKKIGRKKFLLERSDVVAARCTFLRQIRQCDYDKVIFLDETCVKAGDSVWTDAISGKEGIGKGGRLLVAHAGSSAGFVPNGLLIYKPKKTGDSHEGMPPSVFQAWFIKLLDYIPPNSVIVMDNAPYHSVQKDKPPTTAWKKAEIQDWLSRCNVLWTESMLKSELLELVRIHKPRSSSYEVDELAAERGHRVIRLPTDHPQFNPIELIWAQVRGEVAQKNTSLQLSDVEQLVRTACETVSAVSWREAVWHTKTQTEEAWRREGVMESKIESMISELRQNSGGGGGVSEGSDSEEDTSGSDWEEPPPEDGGMDILEELEEEQ